MFWKTTCCTNSGCTCYYMYNLTRPSITSASPLIKLSAFIMSHYRFSQFFISPLFTADATDREINAVDSGTSYCGVQFM